MSDQTLEELYERYPNRKGSQRKKEGMVVLREIVKAGRLEDIRKSITHYSNHCKAEDLIGTSIVQQFKTFITNTWEEWIKPPNGVSIKDSLTEEQKIERGFIIPGELS